MLYSKLTGGAVAALLVYSAPALAADMPAPYTPPPVAAAPAPVVYDWTGVYVGVHAGYGWGDVDAYADQPVVDLTPDGPYSESFDLDGWLAGGQIGANWQVDQIVFGVEGDLSWADIDGRGDPIDPTDAFPSRATFAIDWMGTVRGRIGFAADRFLVYGTGGVAFAGVEAGVSHVEGQGDHRFDDATYAGWTIGAGVEAAFTDNLSAKVEYLYADFGSEDFNFGDLFGLGDIVGEGDLTLHTVRAGLNYRFNLFGKGVPY